MPDLSQLLKRTYELDTESILTELDKHHLSDAQKGILATNIILERLGAQQRRFSYGKPLEAADEECKPTFARSFIHSDWQDGEDVVSAEGSDGDEGFNVRFHKIEHDLDSIGADTANLFRCLAELRADLSTLLEEIKAEINRINADVQSLKPKTGGGRPLPPRVFDFSDIREISPIPSFNQPGGPVVNPRGEYWFGPNFGGPAGMPSSPLGPSLPGGPFNDPGAVWTNRSDATVGVIAGMRATRLAETVFNGDKVELWTTPIGTVMTPVATGTAPSEGYVDPRLEVAGHVGAWAATNGDVIKDKLGDEGFTAEDLQREFGNVDVGGGLTVRDAIKTLPPAENFSNIDAVIEKVGEAQADEIRNAGAGTVAAIGVVGLNLGEAPPADASINNFSPISTAEREALVAVGVNSINDVATTSTDKIADALVTSGRNASDALSLAGRLRGMAGTIRNFGSQR